MLDMNHSLQEMKTMEERLKDFTDEYKSFKTQSHCGYSMLPIEAWKYDLEQRDFRHNMEHYH